MNDPALPRWLAIVAARLAGTAGAILGVVLLGRAQALPDKIIGVALVLGALWFTLIVPRALAHRWRSRP